MSKEYRKRVRP